MKKRILTAALAALMMLPMLGMTAYASSDENYDDGATAEAVETVTEETPVTGGIEDTELEAEENPFTPSGTGTVVDTATDEDGKEFYTITTAAGNIFYLIIDRQRSDGNVYFLNVVTEADLLALAEISETETAVTVTATPAPVQTEEIEEETEPEPEAETGGGMGSILLVVLILLGGGGAGWYFKIYKAKQQQADSNDEFEYTEEESGLFDEDEADPYGDDLYRDDDGDPDGDEDDSPPWDEDGDE